MFAFAETLIVPNVAAGRPRLKPLRQTLETIGALRQLDRDGRLVVTETSAGTRIGGLTIDAPDGATSGVFR